MIYGKAYRAGCNVESLSLVRVFQWDRLGHLAPGQDKVRRAGGWVAPLRYLPYGPLRPPLRTGPEPPLVSQLFISEQLVLNEIEFIRG